MVQGVELLAPSGDFEKMKVAFLYGADAVYFGGSKYSLRANAKNFSDDEIKKRWSMLIVLIKRFM